MRSLNGWDGTIQPHIPVELHNQWLSCVTTSPYDGDNSEALCQTLISADKSVYASRRMDNNGNWRAWQVSDFGKKLSRDPRVSEIGFSDSSGDPATIYVTVDGSRLYIPTAPSNFGIKRLYVDLNPDTSLNALRVDWIAYGAEHTNWIDFSK